MVYRLIFFLLLIISCNESNDNTVIHAPNEGVFEMEVKTVKRVHTIDSTYEKDYKEYDYIANFMNDSQVVWELKVPIYIETFLDSNSLEEIINPSYETLTTFNYSLQEFGVLNEVQNWNRIDFIMDSIASSYLTRNNIVYSDNEMILWKQMMQVYNSHANLESRLAKEIHLFHKAYGLEKQNEKDVEYRLIQIEDSVYTEKIETLFRSEDTVELLFSSSFDNFNLDSDITTLFDRSLPDSNDYFYSMTVVDTCYMTFDLNENIPVQIKAWRVMTTDSMQVSQIINMDEKRR